MSANTDPPTSYGAPGAPWTQPTPDYLRFADDQFDKALASVRRMAEDYATRRTESLQAANQLLCADLAQCRSQCLALRAAHDLLSAQREILRNALIDLHALCSVHALVVRPLDTALIVRDKAAEALLATAQPTSSPPDSQRSAAQP